MTHVGPATTGTRGSPSTDGSLRLHLRRRILLAYFAMGIFCAAFAIMTYLDRGEIRILSAIPAVLGLGLGTWFAITPVVEGFGDHLSLNTASIRGRKRIRYGEVRDVTQMSPSSAHITVEVGGATQRVRLPLSLLSSEDGVRLVTLLRAEMPRGS